MTAENEKGAFGVELAEAVASSLERGASLANSHPGFCGTGLFFAEGRYVFDEVYEGTAGYRYSGERAFGKAVASFETREAFVAWLAAQSSSSLEALAKKRGIRPTQGITRSQLIGFVRSVFPGRL